jgi:NIMA (never in mitosis gene a)-related kinase
MNFLSKSSFRGTVCCYTAPEIFKGQPYDASSDLWSLGCILHELCTLQKAFLGEDTAQIIGKITDGSYEPIPENLSYSDRLRRFVDLLLQKDPKIRLKAAKIHTLPLSELKMPNYAVLTYDDCEKFEG